MSKELYNSVVSKIAIRVPMFAKAIVDKALLRVGANPYSVTPSQMRRALEEQITPRLAAFLKPAERVRLLGSGVLAIDEDDRILQASPAARAMLEIEGRETEETLRERALRAGVLVRVADFHGYGEEVLVREVKLRGRTLNVAMTLVGGRGAARPEASGDAAVSPLRLGGTVVSVLQDVTLTVQLEEEVDHLFRELEAKNERLRRSQDKLQYYVAEIEEATRLKSRLLANVSHELRTPLNAIIGFTDVLLAGYDGPLLPPQRESLDWVAKNSRHLLFLINDLLDLAKIEAGKMDLAREPVELAELLHGVVSGLGILARERGIDLVADVEPELPPIDSDRTRLRQICLNLVANAIKFTRQGSVRVLARREGPSRVVVKVIDTGPGIPPEKLDGIWDEFHQLGPPTERDGIGSGLGLSISRRLAEMLGGSLSAESTVGAGSTFTLELPLARERRSGSRPPISFDTAPSS